MVKMEETVSCTTVRVFLWNEKLTRGQISESEGLCVFLIRTEFMRLNGCECGDSDCDKLGERTCSTVIPFDVSKLLNNDPSLGTMLLSATLQLLPCTTEQLGNSISSYLFTRFQFSEALQLPPRPTYVIVLEFSHLRFIEYTPHGQVSLDDLPWVPPPIPSYCRFDKDWDEEEELRSSARSVSPTDFMNDPYHRYLGDVLEYIIVLREYTGEGGICPTKPPIVSHIPRGLVEVKCFPFPVDQLNGSSRDLMDDDTCPVCHDDFEDKNEVLTTYCSHDFHTECLLIWLQRNNTCPVCRAIYPLHYSPLLNRKRRREHNVLEDNCKHHKHNIVEASV
ncbi:putative e3 ubiquitin-protein ligase rhb1a [Nicotiana attenuata]|uniref:E3 ubiquitin-protein ligase rhb1a n=1 Tax=Nicotiana attenuata TaxID=49451 RepID=A0A314L4F9_NICAT|nr:putative e3 ubiquitin-protein ligase rhb1a [Nicotiana attenuata]